MIPRYTPSEMGQLWSDQRKYDMWLRVESAAADAMADHGLIPLEAARDIRAVSYTHLTLPTIYSV